jgi:hypothetical protein
VFDVDLQRRIEDERTPTFRTEMGGPSASGSAGVPPLQRDHLPLLHLTKLPRRRKFLLEGRNFLRR